MTKPSEDTNWALETAYISTRTFLAFLRKIMRNLHSKYQSALSPLEVEIIIFITAMDTIEKSSSISEPKAFSSERDFKRYFRSQCSSKVRHAFRQAVSRRKRIYQNAREHGFAQDSTMEMWDFGVDLHKLVDEKKLTRFEAKVFDMLREGWEASEIARDTGRHRSSISYIILKKSRFLKGDM